MVIGTAAGPSDGATIALPVDHAFMGRGRGHAVIHSLP